MINDELIFLFITLIHLIHRHSRPRCQS